ncbi:LTA synthase family protein [Pediococcus pentosaceus]
MNRLWGKFRQGLNTKFGFFMLITGLFWIKSYIAYQTKFTLGVQGGMQELILAISPLGFAILLFGIGLYIRGKWAYWYMIIMDIILSTWLFANILYYREFSDFITFNLIKGSGSASDNLGKSLMGILRTTDFLVFIDVIFVIAILAFGFVKIDQSKFKLMNSFAVTVLSIGVLAANLALAYSNRSGLLTRTFDNNYIVKYLGLQSFTLYDGVKSFENSNKKKEAKGSQLDPIKKFIKENNVPANIEYKGVAKGKNVIIIHLESLQQFVINKKWKGEEITPNINKFYKDKNTLAYDNFFNQVGQGKTADAEMMLENSLFGLAEGSAMVTDGTTNTFQSMPALMQQNGYSTAAFHGDVASFWNRDNAYKSFGYQYFFSKQYYTLKKGYVSGYGMKDKLFLQQSAKYLEQLPQPFYAKLITVSNHYPYGIEKKNVSIDKWDTGDSTVDPYVQTAHYLDQSIGELLNHLKKTGLYNKSTIMMYGDHYGISNNHKPAIAKILGLKGVTNYDLAMFQKVPFMIHSPGLKGGVNHNYSGEIDVMPTLLNLLGIKTPGAYQFGHDINSKQYNQIVAFRNGDFVSKKYTKYGGDLYLTATGEQVTDETPAQKQEVKKIQDYVNKELEYSDKIINGDLLRFAKLDWFKKVNKSDYSYNMKSALEQLNKAQSSKTSLIEQNHGKSTLDDYETDAPELESNADKSSSSSSSSSDSSASKSSSSDSSSSSSSSSESSK